MASNCAKCQGIGITPVKNERRNIIYPSTEDNNQEVNIYRQSPVKTPDIKTSK